MEFFVTGISHQAEESLLRSQQLYTFQKEYESQYGANAAAYAIARLANHCWRKFEINVVNRSGSSLEPLGLFRPR